MSLISSNYGEAKLCLKTVVGILKGRRCLIGLRVSKRIILKWTLRGICECVVAGIFRKDNEVAFTTKGDVNFFIKYGDLPVEVKHVLCNTILSPSVLVTICTICCNINKT